MRIIGTLAGTKHLKRWISSDLVGMYVKLICEKWYIIGNIIRIKIERLVWWDSDVVNGKLFHEWDIKISTVTCGISPTTLVEW